MPLSDISTFYLAETSLLRWLHCSSVAYCSLVGGCCPYLPAAAIASRAGPWYCGMVLIASGSTVLPHCTCSQEGKSEDRVEGKAG